METNFQRVPKELLKQYRRRLRIAIIRDLMDLTLFAGTQPEDQLEQVLTLQNLVPFIRVVTGDGCETVSVRHYEIAQTMLRVTATRLQILIDTNYSQIVIPILNNIVMLLSGLKAEPRKLLPEGWKHRQNEINRIRRTILQRIGVDEAMPESQSEVK
jgi:hypothetical protein